MPDFDSGGIARSINRVQFGILSPDEVCFFFAFFTFCKLPTLRQVR